MQLVIFIGMQAAGKSTFYRRNFVNTHIRLNLDMLKTRYREQLLFDACLVAKQSVLIDNTNPTTIERARYIVPARAAGFSVVGFYFQSRLEDCKRRNAERPEGEVVPLPGVLGTYGRLTLPTLQEGFDQLRYVKIQDGEFVVEDWSNEV